MQSVAHNHVCGCPALVPTREKAGDKDAHVLGDGKQGQRRESRVLWERLRETKGGVWAEGSGEGRTAEELSRSLPQPPCL